MMLIGFVLFAVLCSCGISSGNESIDQNGEIKTQFNDLNSDVLYFIFYRLELTTLLKLAQVNSRSLDIAREVARRKYRHSKLKILFDSSRTQTCHESGNDVITIYDLNLALDLLKNFGDCIQSLEFYRGCDDISDTDIDTFFESLNNYCSKSLIQLGIEFLQVDLFEKFTKPFEALKELTIYSRLDKFNETRPLNTLFPNLRKWDLFAVKVVNYTFHNSKFEHLEHLSITGDDQKYNRNIHFAKEMIRLHPTIRSVDIRIDDPTLVSFISQQQPNIENLTILRLGDDIVRLPSLKNLNFINSDENNFNLIEKLRMPRLESLNTYINLADTARWTQFFNNHTQLRSLKIMQTFSINNPFGVLQNVDQITASLTHLTYMSFDVQVESESLVRFIENHKKLNVCQLSGIQLFSDGDKQMIRERLRKEWVLDFDEPYFQRKKPVLE